MDVNAFRHFYDCHFAENRNMWDQYVMLLTDEQFTQPAEYSQGSIKDQIVHMISADDLWFSGLRGDPIPDHLRSKNFPDRESIRVYWDRVEKEMRVYLGALQENRLNDKPLEGEDADLIVWQVLLHVVNHGTDHRAQTLRLLHDMGVKTVSQDYIFYVFDHPE